MRITKLQLRNWGPHELLEADTDAGIVGIVAPNGSGKTNIMQAIKFGLCGQAGSNEEQLHTFVRRVEDSNQPKSASVRLDFRKDGASGYIERRVNLSGATNRKLVWDSQEPLTKAADVDGFLSELLGIDKYVIENAIFIPQGELDKLLFGTQAEREDKFIKIMLLGYMSRAAKVADTKAKVLARDVVDQSALRDELNTQLRKCEETLEELERQLKRTPDLTKEIEQWRKVISLTEKIAHYEADLKNAIQAAKEADEAIAGILASAAVDVSSAEELKQKAKELQEEYEKVLDGYQHQIKAQNTKDKLDRLRQEWGETRQELKTSQTKLDSLNVDEESYEKDKRTLLLLEERARLENNIQENKNLIQVSQPKLKKLEYQKKNAEEARDRITDQMHRLEELRSVEKYAVDVLEQAIGVLAHKHDEEIECPVCGSSIGGCSSSDKSTGTPTRSLKQLSDFRTNNLHILSNQLETLRENLQEVLQKIDNNEINIQQVAIETAKQTIASAQARIAQLPSGDIASLEKSVELQAKYISEYREVLAKVSACTARFSKIKKLADSVSAEEKAIEKTFDQNVLKSLQNRLSELKPIIHILGAQLSSLERAQESKRVHIETSKKIQELIRRSTEEAENISLLPRISSILSSISNEDSIDRNALKSMAMEKLETYQGQHNELKGSYNVAEQTANEIRKRINEIEERESANKRRLEVIEDLKIISNTFSRAGLPRTCVDYNYKIITQAAGEFLNELGCPFRVQASSEKPVTLEFIRNDNSSGVAFDQSKLSGGQRVNVSVSFLLAIQKLLVSDFGLMGMDEPTTHIDSGGKEALRDVLTKIGPLLNSSESQVWVIDHDEILATAFNKTIKL